MSEPVRLLGISELSVSRQGEAKQQLDKISMAVEVGETVVLLGEASSGTDTVMRALNGSLGDGEAMTGTIKIGGQGEGGNFGVGPLRIAYLPGPTSHPLSPNASAISQFSRIIARRIRAPLSSSRAEFAQELGRLEGAPPLAAFEKRAGEISPAFLAWGLLATALAQTPGLLLVDHLFESLPPREARALEKAVVAAKIRLHCTLVCATMSTETAIRLGGRVVIMRQGRIVEEGPLSRLTTAQAHAYTQTLFKENVALERTSARGHAVVQALGISFRGGPRNKSTRGRDELNFELCRGASLALIGEEGSGRHALMRQILGMNRPEKGRIIFDAVDLGILSQDMISRLRRRVAVIAGTDNALDPRMSLWETVAEPLRTHLQLPRDVLASYRDAALRRVGLASLPGQLPIGTLSAFDRRRLQVARAIVTAPALAIIDEPFRGLDAFARSVIRDLLQSFRDEEGPAFLVITSDFAVAKALAEDAMVFRDGQVIERGTIAELTRAPKNPYTRMLVEASKLEAPPVLPDKPAVTNVNGDATKDASAADTKPGETGEQAKSAADLSVENMLAGVKSQSETDAKTAV